MHIETILEKGVGTINEDAVFVSEERFGVFDGVTSIDRYVDEEGKTGGYRAAQIAVDVFTRSTKPLRQAALEANDAIREVMIRKEVDVDTIEKLWATTLAVVQIDLVKREFEWVQIADSCIVVIEKDGTSRAVTKKGFPDSEILMEWRELGQRKTPDIRSKVIDKIIKLRKTANIVYGVLNGDPNAERFLNLGTESLENVAHILIFTDGFLIPRKDPSAPDDFFRMGALFLSGGLKKVRDHIRELEESDPNCWEYPRYKKSDDMAAVAISFN